MRYVENILPQQDRNIVLFGKTGNILEGEETHKLPHHAKIIRTSEGSETYYIRTYQGTLFDPMGPYGKRERTLDTQVKKVSKSTFDLYVTYLKTNNSIYLTKAQRGFLND